MKILVINSGSSSIKFQLFNMEDESVLAVGLVERIGDPEGLLSYIIAPGTENEASGRVNKQIADHKAGMYLLADILAGAGRGVVGNFTEIAAVGHRVVHGGEDFRESVLITAEVMAVIEKNITLAPLHNPANIDGIRVSQELFPAGLQVAVFDTAFHQSLPPRAFHYALPFNLYDQYRIRRYGFHGTSHKYVAGECARLMGRSLQSLNMITIHLGNGCSMAAVAKGRSIDTTLGLTPLEGLVMGTRSGDVDPALHLFLNKNCSMDIEMVDDLLNKQSGLKGMCGYNDMRDIHGAIAAGDPRAKLALEVQTYRNKKYIGAFMAVLGRVDSIVFTAGIGENDAVVRQKSVAGLEELGIILDPDINGQRDGGARKLSSSESRVEVWTIPTNEELAIAREARIILAKTS